MKKKHLWIIVTLYIVWIYSHSFMNGSLSNQESGTITRIILEWLHQIHFSITFDQLHHFIRKLAHFTEYAGLGFLTYLINQKQPLFHRSVSLIAFGLLIPAVDETIQLFVPERAGAFKDVLLDFSGYLFGALLLYCLWKLIHHRK